MNEFAPWEEWKKHCDSAKCSDDARATLYQFARTCWNHHLDEQSGGGDVPETGEVAGEDPWHRFESHCAIKQTTEGKSYKDWLFDRIRLLPNGTPADKVRSGAFFVMRWVVQDFLRKEGRFRLRRFGRPQPSLSESVHNSEKGKSEEGLTKEDLLPDTVASGQDVELRDLQRIAVEEAQALVRRHFSERQRIVFTAVAMQVPLSHPEVERIAGCKKSVLSDTVNKTLREIAANIHRDYDEDDPLVRDELIRYVVRAVLEICAQPDNSPETWKTHLFSVAVGDEP